MKKVIPTDAVLMPDKAKRVFKGILFDVYQWSQKEFDDSEKTYEMLKRPDTVICIGVVDGKLLVTEDEQPVAGVRLGFPGGKVDETDHSILEAARREVLEETGYDFSNWKLLDVFQPHRKLEWFVHVLVADQVLKVIPPRAEPGEKIEVKLLSFDEVKELSIKKVGYLGEAYDLLVHAHSIQDLLDLPEFSGKEVDR